MPNLLSILTRDHRKLAENHLREGRKSAAVEELAKAGDYDRAAKLAAQIRDEPALVRCVLLAVCGELPPRSENMNAMSAGELVAARGHHDKAILLFELAGDYRRAAACAVQLRQLPRAARLFEKARAWAEAAALFEEADELRDALRVLDNEARLLEQDGTSRNRPATPARLLEVRLKRADLYLRLGKTSQAVEQLRRVPPSTESAKLLERAGQHSEAVAAYLESGNGDEAVRLARSSPDAARLEAQICLRSGRAVEAGDLFARAGCPREAAEAYEKGAKWGAAAYRWEAAGESERAAAAYVHAGRPQDAARCYAAAGKPDLAAQAYADSGDLAAAAAVHVQAGKPMAAVTLLVTAGDAVAAGRLLEQTAADQPELRDMTLAVVPLLVEHGLPAQALTQLRRLPAPAGRGRTAPAPVDSLYWEGRAQEALGQRQAARECYRQVIRANPDYRDAATRSAALDTAANATVWPESAAPQGGLAAGSHLGERYEILGELGRGGMGQVFKARDLELGELVAIKVLTGGCNVPQQQERLLREVQICRRISHPNVVRVFDMGRFPGGAFVTMELLEGQTLDELIDPLEAMPFERVKRLLTEIAAGLREAHALGIVHRDLKPSNLFVTARNLKILDFGIARMTTGTDTRLTQTGFVFGSPPYMSPEQLLGQTLDGRSDLYSVGIVAYALLAGREPFVDENPNVLMLKHLRESPPDLRRFRPDVPNSWLVFVEKLLAKQPEDRFQSAEEVLAALESLPAPASDANSTAMFAQMPDF